jgi:hypothetical protein
VANPENDPVDPGLLKSDPDPGLALFQLLGVNGIGSIEIHVF